MQPSPETGNTVICSHRACAFGGERDRAFRPCDRVSTKALEHTSSLGHDAQYEIESARERDVPMIAPAQTRKNQVARYGVSRKIGQRLQSQIARFGAAIRSQSGRPSTANGRSNVLCPVKFRPDSRARVQHRCQAVPLGKHHAIVWEVDIEVHSQMKGSGTRVTYELSAVPPGHDQAQLSARIWEANQANQALHGPAHRARRQKITMRQLRRSKAAKCLARSAVRPMQSQKHGVSSPRSILFWRRCLKARLI